MSWSDDAQFAHCAERFLALPHEGGMMVTPSNFQLVGACAHFHHPQPSVPHVPFLLPTVRRLFARSWGYCSSSFGRHSRSRGALWAKTKFEHKPVSEAHTETEARTQTHRSAPIATSYAFVSFPISLHMARNRFRDQVWAVVQAWDAASPNPSSGSQGMESTGFVLQPRAPKHHMARL